MKDLHIETERLTIVPLREDMAEDMSRNSLDEDVRRFVPDEVFETPEEAAEAIEWLMDCYHSEEEPWLFPVLLKDGANIGYVQLCPVEEGWEIGYHIAAPYTGKGYAAEAVKAFLPEAAAMKGIDTIVGVCLAENKASIRVLEKCGFVKTFEGKDHYQGELRDVVIAEWRKA